MLKVVIVFLFFVTISIWQCHMNVSIHFQLLEVVFHFQKNVRHTIWTKGCYFFLSDWDIFFERYQTKNLNQITFLSSIGRVEIACDNPSA
jgi:hypothetical protein